MDNYKKNLDKKLLVLYLIASISAVILYIFWSHTSPLETSNRASNFIYVIQSTFFIGLYIGIIKECKKILGAKKNIETLKKLYIEESDERNKLITEKTFSVGFNITFIGIILATVYAGFINSVIFFTLLFVTIFMLLVQGLLKLYYSKTF